MRVAEWRSSCWEWGLSASAAAEEKAAASPNAREKGWVSARLANKGDEDSAFSACVGRVMGACLGIEAPREIKPFRRTGALEATRPSVPRYGTTISIAGMARRRGASLPRRRRCFATRSGPGSPIAARWTRKERCPFPFVKDNRADFLMRETARRALQFRTIAMNAC